MQKFGLAVLMTIALFMSPLRALSQVAVPSTPLSELERRAASGDTAAMMELGDKYRAGDGVPMDLDRALDWYTRPAASGDVNANFFMGYIMLWRGSEADHRRARQLFDRSLRLCENEVNRATCDPLQILRYVAIAERELALYDDALKSARRGIELARTAGDEMLVGNLHEEMGMSYERLGLPDEALANYKTALEIYERVEGKDGASAGNLLLNMGNALDNQSRHEEAIDTYRLSLANLTRHLGPESSAVAYLHINIGWSLAQLKRYDEAYAESARGYDILRRQTGPGADKIGYVLNNMGIIREWQGRHVEAIALNLKSLVVYERFEDITLAPKRWALRSLSNSYAALGKKDSAILFAKMAVNTHQQIRALNAGLEQGHASALTESWRGIYHDLADLLVGEGRIAEAQFVLNLLKQQELIEFVRRDSAAGANAGATSLTGSERKKSEGLEAAMAGPIALAAELETLTQKQQAGTATPDEVRRIAALNEELDRSYEAFIEGVDQLLDASDGEASSVQEEIQALNLEYAADRQDMLKDFERPTVLLQAASLGETLNLFLTTKDISVHRRVQVSRADLSRSVFDALNLIEERSPDADAKLAELYQMLISPVEGDLIASGAEVIMLNLGGFLRYLPFAALRSERGYLVEDYALVLDTPAAQTKFETTDRQNAQAAGFGVTAAHAGFSPLPGVAKELEAIFEGADAQGKLSGSPVLDTDFTADSLRDALKKKPRLLHVASHFKFVPGNETDSFLLLGNGDPLSLAQIRKGRGFRFGGVDLLTLSACETAKGSDAEGDEVESFGAIAQMNGASAVMATLWPIADDASGTLMANFYEGLVSLDLDKADALRRAQIAMLRGVSAETVNLAERGMTDPDQPSATPEQAVTTRHPYYWSPFILMGNWL